jgi:cellulose synthase (UDP-forming)
MQPFRFHVSEDLLTSVQLHGEAGQGWKSVYHPGIECRMLSPWSLDAVMVQRLKYAGGTFDILLRHAPLFRRGMSLPARLHYAATFWSYLSVLWAPVLLFAPAVALVTGLSPVAAHSGEYFLRLLPPLIAGELAMILACKGHDFHLGRAMALTLLPVHARALWSVLRGQRPRFPPTPKTPVLSPGLRHVMPNLAIIAVLLAAICVGLTGLALGRPGHDAPLVVANCFWAVWSIWAVARILPAVVWRPEPALAAAPARPLSPALTGVPT